MAKQDPALLERGCASGKVGDCLSLGVLYETGVLGDGGAESRERKVAYWQRVVTLSQESCDRGQLAGCSELANAYWLGRGVARDPGHAATLYTRSCDGGIAQSCSHLARLYRQGSGVERDPVKAAALYDKSCRGGAPFGCHWLGEMYEGGEGVAPDPARATALYQKACKRGFRLSCEALARLGAKP